ncbi:MAG: hypothetical protein HKN03_19355 [Acidimicrobiales bacterium]|nr:hypothetical protein [Acidimicrobiales bacterium]
MGTLKKNYAAPLLTPLGAFTQVTAGTMGSLNDGGGVGQGMADLDNMGGMDN